MAEDENVTVSETPAIVDDNETTEVDKPILEKDEDELFRMRSKLFRWAKEADPPEWKERGTGDVTLLKHKETSKIRLLMRREKTYKTCANHYLDPSMKLQANIGSDRAWVWTVPADFADEEPKEELLAIRFLNSEIANNFKDKFEECQDMMKQLQQEVMLKKLNNLTVLEDDEEEDNHASGEKEEAANEEKKDEVEGGESSSTNVTADDDVNCSGEKPAASEAASASKSSPVKTPSAQEQKEDVPEK